MPFDPHGGGHKFDDGGGGAVRDEASCIVVQQAASSGGDSGSTLKAHDYIGLAEVSSAAAAKAPSPAAAVPDLNLGETELRLGPPKAAALKPQSEVSKEKSTTHWRAQAQAQAQRNAVEPQEMSAPKKRGFSEAIGNGFVEGRCVMPSIGASPAATSQAASPASSKKNSANPLMPPYSWNVNSSSKLPAAWRTGLEQSKGASFGPFPSPASRPKVVDENRSSWDNSSPAASTKHSNGSSGLSSQQQEQQSNNKEDSSDEVAPVSSPPVVGWPPVQSFRKNTLASHPPPPASSQQKAADNKTSSAAAAAAAATANVAAPPPRTAAAAAGGSTTSVPLFVKVYMDGVPIGRKVDLKSHNSYEKLSAVLEEMFHRFVSGQSGEISSSSSIEANQNQKKLNFLHGSDFVLTYEDKEGDHMLVGDVPWEMFTGTVKRLRIMKGSEAVGQVAPRSAGDNKAAA